MSQSPALKVRTGRLIFALALVSVVSGCGFQLRGTSPVPEAVQPLMVKCSSQIPDSLCLSLKRQLELGGVKVAGKGDEAYTLNLGDFGQDRRASAITVRAGAAEYMLTQTVHIDLISPDHVPLIADTALSVRESYRYDETNVLAKQREQDELEQRLYDRLAQQILFRLAPLTPSRIDSLREEYQSAQTPETENAGPQ